MEIRLLGPLDVWQGSTRVELGAPKQQALFVHLAIRVGRVVASEELIEGLWPEDPPPSAAKSVQVYVSNLRRVLPPASIATRAGGYELTAGDVDAVRFERLIAAARADLAVGRYATAAAALREGLSLWRGEALEGFRDELFAGERVLALEELRLSALEMLFRTEVDRGRGRDVVTELQSAVREQPLREGLRALLMQALYQAGRQAEALAVYHDGRRLLDAELGVDPSPELQRTERAILLQDSDLLGPRAGAPRAHVAQTEQKIATIMVALPGTLSTDDLERQIGLLGGFSQAVISEIDRAGGTAERLGDGAIRGIFGVPVAHEDHIDRAIEATTRVMARIRETFGEELQPRIGVESGSVVVQSSDTTLLVVGSAPAQAGQLAALAAPGEVLVGARAVHTATRFTFGPLAVVPGGSSLRYAPLITMNPSGFLPMRPGKPAIVGRQRELRLLAERLNSVMTEGTPSFLVLIGDAGVGKTRVAEVAAQRRPGGAQPVRQLWGRCVAYGDARTYSPVADMLRSHLGLGDDDPAATLLHRLGERSILGLALGLDVASGDHPLTAQERLQSAWVDLVKDLVAEQALVLTFEDLHWADQPLLDLIGRTVAQVDGPLLVVATARPEFIERWNEWGGARADFAALWLEPLSSADADQLLQERSGGLIAGPWQQAALARAEGNPFFLEALVGSLRDAGQLSGARLDERVPMVIPDSIQATISARIDLLAPRLKAILQVAAVIGREFSSTALDAVLSAVDLPAAYSSDLRILSEREFVRPVADKTSAASSTYTFRHALTRDVAFESLPPGRRAVLHEAFAGWLLRHNGGRDEDAPELAYHLAAAATGTRSGLGADLREQAVRWLSRAAQLAMGRYELDAADRMLRRAIELTEQVPTSAGLWRTLAHIAYLRYDGEGFWTAMEQALRLTTGTVEQAEMYSLLAETTAIRRGMWRRQPTQVRLDDWIGTALRLAPQHSLSRARALVARAWTASPRAATRVRDLQEASGLAGELGDVELRSHVLGEQVREDLAHYRFSKAREVVRSHLALGDTIVNPDEQALILQQGVANLLSCGALADAADAAQRLEVVAARLSPHHRIHAVASEASVRLLTGSSENVLELVATVRDRMAASSETPCVAGPWTMLVCATAALRSGEAALAVDLETEADAWMMEGYDAELGAQRIQHAILRRDLAALRQTMSVPLVDRWNAWFLSAIVPPYLDALVALADRDRIEADARPLADAGGLFQPFARRALAIAAGDAGGLGAAQEQLLALKLLSAAADTTLLRDLFDRKQRGPGRSEPLLAASESADR